MRFGGEKVLTVRFCFLGTHTRARTHTGEAQVIKCQHLINLLYYFLQDSVALKYVIMKNVLKGQEYTRLLMVRFLEKKCSTQ